MPPTLTARPSVMPEARPTRFGRYCLPQDDHRAIRKIQSRTEDDETEDTENGAVRPCENERGRKCEEEAEADKGAIAMLVAQLSADQCEERADAIVHAEEQVAEIL